MWQLCVRVLCLSCARLDAVPFGPWLSVWGYGNIDFRFVWQLRLQPTWVVVKSEMSNMKLTDLH